MKNLSLHRKIKQLINDRLALIIFFIIIFLIGIMYLDGLIENTPNNEHKYEFIIALFTACTAIATLFIALAACLQIQGLKKTADADFLLRIDISFRDSTIQEANYILYKFRRSSKSHCPKHKIRNSSCINCENAVVSDIQNKLMTIYSSDTDLSNKKRYMLRLYLDHLETISYYVNSGYLDFDDIKTLYGGFIKYHYQLLEKWIKEEQSDDDKDAYSQLTTLKNKLDQTF